MSRPNAALTLGRRRRARSAEETRDLVLDAAEECFARFGLAQTTIDDVVRVAKVPRATLYRHAGGKDDLVAAVALREIDRFFVKLAEFVKDLDTVDDVLVDGTLFTVDHFRSNVLLAMALAPQSTSTTARLIKDVIVQARDRMVAFVQPMFEHGQRSGTVRPDLTAQDGTELLLRMIGSLTVAPSPWLHTPEEQRAFLHRVLVPAFVPDAARSPSWRNTT